jgi:hypothetical protein
MIEFLLGIIAGSLITSFILNYRSVTSVKNTIEKIHTKFGTTQAVIVDMSDPLDIDLGSGEPPLSEEKKPKKKKKNA